MPFNGSCLFVELKYKTCLNYFTLVSYIIPCVFLMFSVRNCNVTILENERKYMCTAGQNFTRIASCALHTIQRKHLQINKYNYTCHPKASSVA